MTKLQNLNVLTLAALTARNLGHGCAPERTEFTDVNDLYTAMDEAAAKDNDGKEDFAWAAPWPKTDSGTLCHSTKTGRMRIEVGNHFIRFDLFTPSFGGGESPYFTFQVTGGAVVSANMNPQAREVLWGRLDRLSHVGGYMLPLVGFEAFSAAADSWTLQAVVRERIVSSKETIRFNSNFPDGYYPSGVVEANIARAEEELTGWKFQLVQLIAEQGDLLRDWPETSEDVAQMPRVEAWEQYEEVADEWDAKSSHNSRR